jgi:hypothetical protein
MDMRLKGGAMDRIYIGVDFHARQQTICYLKIESAGECEVNLMDDDRIDD